jgi:hypothetical protein
MPRIDDYKAAVALAVEELRPQNPQRLAGKAGGEYFFENDQEGVLLPYFGQLRRITWPEVKITLPDGSDQIPLTEQILILHYLSRATGALLTGHEVDFRQVPEGGFYWSAFVSRAQKPLLQTFGRDLDLYLKVAAQMGGEPVELGDAAARFMAFPLAPVTHILWRGDDEFDPEAKILFDATIAEHLSTEDIAALAGASVYRLMGLAYKLRQAKAG